MMAMTQKRYWRYQYANNKRGRKPAEEFLSSLSDKENAKFQALMRQVAYSRQYHNKQKFKKLNTSDGIWQFRSGDYRMLCYQLGNCFYLTNGFKKDQNKTDKYYIDLAINIKKENIKKKG